MVQGLLVAVDNLTAEVRVEVRGVAQNLEEATDSFLCLILGFLLHIDTFVGLVKMLKNAVHKFKQLKRRLVVEFHHGQVLHEGRTV